ncbi:MAG: SIMPL domain-containing protein [Stellaceae bacterium]
MSPLRSLIFGLMAAIAAAPAAAQTAPAAANMTVLHLSETAQRGVPRDRLRIELAAQAVDANASKVQAEINRRMAAALARIKSAPDIAVETQGYSVYPEHSDKGPTRWHGSQSVALTGKDFGAVLVLVGALQQDGLIVQSMTPELSREARLAVEDELTDVALQRLRRRAEHIAADLGTKVETFRDLHIGNAAPPPPVPLRAMMAMKGSAAAPPPVAEAGEATVSVSVSADIALAPQR